MRSRESKLQAAATKAKQLVDDLQNLHPDSKQWNYSLMERNLKDTYVALKEVWQNGKDLEKVKEYLSDSCIRFLQGNSEWVDVKWFDLLECFDFELEDVAIISVINLPGKSEDKFIAWLDHEIASENGNDLEKDRAHIVEDFGLADNMPSLSGFSLSAFGKSFLPVVAPNDCWTFKWSEERERWVLDFITFDRSTDAILSTLGKSINAEDDRGFDISNLN